MNDWGAYDAIADAYERVAAPRFETVARPPLALAEPAEGAPVLDLGTGTASLRSVAGVGLRRPRITNAGCR